MWKIFQEKLRMFFPNINGHLDPFVSVTFVERILRQQKRLARKALRLVSPLYTPFWNISGPGFCIVTKGVIS